MKNFAFLILLTLLFSHCKEKNRQPEPLPEINDIVSRWRLISYESKSGDSTIVETSPDETKFMSFRYDGIPLDSLDQELCCPPSSYLINGKLFEIKQIGGPPKYNPSCALVYCAGCAQWKLTQAGDKLTIEYCWDYKEIYQRAPKFE